MVVIAYYPPTGIIDTILVQNPAGQIQHVSKETHWYIGTRWSSMVAKQGYLKNNGFVELPKPLDFEFFIQHIKQFEGS